MLSRDFAKTGNENCTCDWLDRTALATHPAARANPDQFERLIDTHPHLFSNTVVYVSNQDMRAMLNAVSVIEDVAALPLYQSQALNRAPAIALPNPGPRGALMGYDFHLTATGPKLIEINTNAGGAFLNAIAADSLRYCCDIARDNTKISKSEGFEKSIVEMFKSEYQLQGNTRPLQRIAIVDAAPHDQYLFPEFEIAAALLRRHSIEAIICDAKSLTHRDGALWIGTLQIDLVYNRVVDFMLDQPIHAALASAYAAGDVVVTPNPHTHAVLADKRNLAVLSDQDFIAEMDLSVAQRNALSTVPKTEIVTNTNLDALWTRRNGLFFKPFAGYGGKAVYRGNKLTKKVWGMIAAGGYVAQELVEPIARVVKVNGVDTRQKADVRLYTYQGELLLASARLYQGQTTNMRTPGGGFAGVVLI